MATEPPADGASGSPSARKDFAMTFDEANGRVVLFGGCLDGVCSELSDETWTWDGHDWTLHDPPEPRPEAAFWPTGARGKRR